MPTEHELFITITPNQCIIGPVYDPALRGICYTCFFFRFLGCQANFTQILEEQKSTSVPVRSLTKEEEAKLFQAVNTLLTIKDSGAIFCIENGQLTQQRLLPRSDCDFCVLPFSTYRVEDYTNPLCGLIQRIETQSIPLDENGAQYFWQVQAYLANHRLRLQWEERGRGKGVNHHSACLGAIAESFERYGHNTPLPEADLSLLIPSGAESLDHENDTVTAYELSTKQPIRLPRYLVQKSSRKFYDWSGLAAHTVEEKAIKNGLLEVLERDAFLKAWYEQTELWSIPHPISKTGVALVSFLEKQGCRVLFAATKGMMNTVTVMAVTLSTNRPRLVLGLGCCTSLAKAQQKALEELVQVYTALQPYTVKDEYSPALNLLQDPKQVLSALEHGLYYAAYGSEEDLPSVFFRSSYHYEKTDSKSTFDFNNIDAPVYYSKLTPPDIRILGWHVVKVIIPSAQSLRFGYQNMHAPADWVPRTRASILHPLC
jgi:thiazole/oxazole-forming peptide maturase SagD family component